MRIRVKPAAVGLAAALAIPVVVLGPASAAHAAPAECTKTVTVVPSSKPNLPKTTVTARCASGTGQYRAVLKCVRVIGTNYWVTSTLYGEWATAGQGTSSTVVCNGPELGSSIQFA